MAHTRRSVRCKQEHKTWVQKLGLVGVVAFVIALGLAINNSRVRSVEMKAHKNCARMEVVIKLIDQGIVPPPDATDEQIAAFEYANGFLRSVVAAALSESEC